MPHRPAVWVDLLPASKVLAAAFDDDYLFGHYIHPRRKEYPDDVYLYYLRWLRDTFYAEPGEYLVVTYSVNAETGKEDHITGIAHWLRYYSDPPKASLSSQAMMKAVSLYNAAETHFYPNRAIDYEHEKILPLGNPFFEHHWTGTRADCWHLSLLGVHPSEMRRGYGRELVAWGFERSRDEGVSVSVVSVPGQQAFYRKCGFDVQVGTMSDEGGAANPHNAAGLEEAPILFCDHGQEAKGMKKYGEK